MSDSNDEVELHALNGPDVVNFHIEESDNLYGNEAATNRAKPINNAQTSAPAAAAAPVRSSPQVSITHSSSNSDLLQTASEYFTAHEQKLHHEETIERLKSGMPNNSAGASYRPSISVDNNKFGGGAGSSDLTMSSRSGKSDEPDFLTTVGPACAVSGVSLTEPSKYSLLWRDVNLRASGSRGQPGKLLLRNCSGYIAGGIHAIMSQSGHGKTMLLNLLARRVDPSIKQESGTVLLNGKPYASSEIKPFASYILQGDALNANLTVLETVQYAAYLKLPASMSTKDKDARVEEVLREVGLWDARNVIVGDPLMKGISGGERKRLCVAVGVVHKPKLIFADESTTGLDSFRAMELVKYFRRLTRQENCTVLVAIHQPTLATFRMFDGLILLKSGEIMYSGSIPSALGTFERLGFPCPPFTNPADHLFDVMSDVSGEYTAMRLDEQLADAQKVKIQGIIERQMERFDQYELKWHQVLSENEKRLQEKASWWQTFEILCHRALQEQKRLKWNWCINLFQTLVMAALIGTVLFFFCVFQGIFGSLGTINSFPYERNLTLRERADGAYGASAYFLSKSLVEAAIQAWIPVLFSIIAYFSVGLREEAEKFWLFAFFMVLCSLAATSLSLAVVCLCRTAERSVIVLPISFELTRLFGGFFLSPSNLPDYFSWLDAMSYIKYTYVGISLNEFQGVEPFGSARIKVLGLDYISLGGCIGSLFALVIGFRVVAYLALRFLKN